MKVAVITGAANGIGLALSKICLQNNLCLVMVDKDRIKLNHEAAQLEELYPNSVLAISCDMTQIEQVEQLVPSIDAQWGRIDYVFNNAGIIGTLAPTWELEVEQIDRAMHVNVYGMIHLIKTITPYLFQQHFRSHIINMASLYALSTGSQMATYSMTKHAVLALTESLYFDLQRLEKPVDVSIVFPSFTDTALLNSNPLENQNPFHNSLAALLSHSRPVMDVAQHIFQDVLKKRFYILPDKEVKSYCEERVKAIVLQESPHMNNVESFMRSLIRRADKKA